MNAIKLNHVTKCFGETRALADFTLAIPLGRPTILMGPSGGGKTTILRILLGLETPDCGEALGLEDLRTAAVFQEDRLCENLSALANACLPHGHLRGPERTQLHERVEALFDAVGLTDCASRPVRDLSGGMKRRVAIARAVLADFDLIVFDEPLKGLDPATKDATMAAILPLLEGKTTVWVTHDADDLAYFTDAHVVRM